MDNTRLFPLTSDDLARIEHRARGACESGRRDTLAYKLAVDVMRLLDERQRLLRPGEPSDAR